jgi:hypothetical protein
VKDGGWVITVATPIPHWDKVRGIEDARKRGVKELFFIVKESGDQLEGIAKMVQDGTLKPRIGHLVKGLTEDSARDIEGYFLEKKSSGGTIVVQVYPPHEHS